MNNEKAFKILAKNHEWFTEDYLNGNMDEPEITTNEAISAMEEYATLENTALRERVKVLENLAETQKEYIQFLSDNISKNVTFLHAHGIITNPDIVQKGIELRAKIKEFSAPIHIKGKEKSEL